MQNLFELSLEEKERWLKDLADLMGVWEDWRLLATHGEHLLPLASQVAHAIQERLKTNPHTQDTDPVERALEAIAQVYFNEPTLDAAYLERRAQAGRAYLQAGLGPAQLLAGIYGLWVDEWSKAFTQLFPDPGLQARFNRALALVSLFNAAVVLTQYAYEAAQAQRLREEEFLRAVGISRELYQQMAKAAGKA